MNCDRCESVNAGDRKFCRECGASLLAICEHCSFENELDAKHCGGCGKLVRAPRGNAAGTSESRDGPSEIFHWMLAQAIEVTTAELRKKAAKERDTEVESNEAPPDDQSDEGEDERDEIEIRFASWEGIRFPFQPQQIAKALNQAIEN